LNNASPAKRRRAKTLRKIGLNFQLQIKANV
jgi:hypothetical protein